MEEIYLLILGIAFCLTAITYLALSQKQREVLFRRLRLRGRRASSATTPPRSLSPEKKAPITVQSPTEYIDSFPGSRREALARVMEMIPQANKGNVVDLEAEKSMTSDMMMPYEANYVEVDGSKHTPTGFSVGEIKGLGDFPDYAELSGVPLPEPYHDFDVTKALPRPYRPFRWAYHQTMCMLTAGDY
jgi:flagellar basal body rod protein FlgB